MTRHALRLLCGAVLLTLAGQLCAAPSADPRLREVVYDPHTVVTVPVARGVVTLVEFDADEAITEAASGQGGDCGQPEAAWCIVAPPGGHHLFVKPKHAAGADNNLVVITDRRTHTFRFVVRAEGDPRTPVYRLVIKAPAPLLLPAFPTSASAPSMAPQLSPISDEALVAARLQARPPLRNTRYTVAEGKASQDIVRTLVFDDGRFTYLRFPGNAPVPAVFEVQGDGAETLVNTRMEDKLLVVDRVSRRLNLRAGSAVVGVWNEAFDHDGLSTQGGTTVPGLQRVLKASSPSPSADATEPHHE